MRAVAATNKVEPIWLQQGDDEGDVDDDSDDPDDYTHKEADDDAQEANGDGQTGAAAELEEKKAD